MTSAEVVAVISDIFAPMDVSLDSNLDDLEATSVLLLKLMVALQRRFDIELDVVDMFSVEDVNDLVQLVVGRVS